MWKLTSFPSPSVRFQLHGRCSTLGLILHVPYVSTYLFLFLNQLEWHVSPGHASLCSFFHFARKDSLDLFILKQFIQILEIADYTISSDWIERWDTLINAFVNPNASRSSWCVPFSSTSITVTLIVFFLPDPFDLPRRRFTEPLKTAVVVLSALCRAPFSILTFRHLNFHYGRSFHPNLYVYHSGLDHASNFHSHFFHECSSVYLQNRWIHVSEIVGNHCFILLLVFPICIVAFPAGGVVISFHRRCLFPS